MLTRCSIWARIFRSPLSVDLARDHAGALAAVQPVDLREVVF